jgi:hypothetical protein
MEFVTDPPSMIQAANAFAIFRPLTVLMFIYYKLLLRVIKKVKMLLCIAIDFIAGGPSEQYCLLSVC